MTETRSRFVCDMTALTREQRERHAVLKASLASSVLSRRELPDGYLFAIDPNGLSASEIDEWTGLETKCCPFFRLSHTKAEDMWDLRIEGTDVKPFIQIEFPEFFRKSPATL